MAHLGQGSTTSEVEGQGKGGAFATQNAFHALEESEQEGSEMKSDDDAEMADTPGETESAGAGGRLSGPVSEGSIDPEAWESQNGTRVPKFSEDPQHREIADENAPFDADWFVVMERSLETGSMAHRWDEIAKTWFVKVAMESLKANVVTLLKRRRDDLGTLAERAQQPWEINQRSMRRLSER